MNRLVAFPNKYLIQYDLNAIYVNLHKRDKFTTCYTYTTENSGHHNQELVIKTIKLMYYSDKQKDAKC